MVSDRLRGAASTLAAVIYELGPFEPGTGRLPPYLAGREAEQDTLRALVRHLRRGRAAPSNVVCYGPRGNGKTALLRWLEQDVASGNARRSDEDREIETVWLTPSQIPTVARLIERVACDSWLTAWWQRLGVSVGVPGVVGASLGPAPAARLPALEDALSDRVKKKSLVVMLDEAHTLDPDVGHALLNASQQIGREGAAPAGAGGDPGPRGQD